MMIRHYVTFYSPGTIVAEKTTKEIERWDTEAAVKMFRSIKERHGAIPYGFFFTTRERSQDDFDSRETERSNFYWLGGAVLTLAELRERNDPKDRILISNMEANGWDKVVENRNSWKWTQPLNEGDIILDIE